jgi:preprotein translocase subunit YajC
MNLIYFFLQAASQEKPFPMYLLFGAMLLVIWLFFLRPSAKRSKDQQKFTTNIEKGTKVVTIAGIHGTISKVNEDGTTIQLEVSPGMNMKIEKSTISMEMSNKLNGIGVDPAKK